MTHRDAIYPSSWVLFAILIGSSYSLAKAPPDLATECASVEQDITLARGQLSSVRRNKEFGIVLDRILRVNAALKSKSRADKLPDAFLRNCVQKSIEAFSVHRQFMPPSIRQSAAYLASIGSFYREFGKLKDANENYQLALKLAPQDGELRWEAFRTWLDYSLSLPATPTTRADTARRTDDFIGQARELMQPILNDTARTAAARVRQRNALRFFAKFLEAVNEPALAFEEWKQLQKLAPDDDQANAKVITYYLARSDFASAKELLARLTSGEKPEPFYVESLAKIHRAQGQPAEAAAFLSRFVKSPALSSPKLEALYAMSLADAGRAPEAEKFLQTLSTARRQDAELQEAELRVGVHRARRNLQANLRGAAVADYMRYLKHHPEDKDVSFEAAQVLRGGGKPDRKLAAELVQPFALKNAALTDAQLALAVEILAAEPSMTEAAALVCTRFKKEHEHVPAASRLGCAQAWVKEGQRDLAKAELESTLEEVRGRPEEKVYLKSLTEF